DDLAEVLQMDVARDELRVGVRDRDDRLLEVRVGEARRAPERARTRHVPPGGRRPGTVFRHEILDRGTARRGAASLRRAYGAASFAATRAPLGAARSRPGGDRARIREGLARTGQGSLR